MNKANKMNEQEKRIAKAIHYPECWDVMAYPTLASALWEMNSLTGHKFYCMTCGKVHKYPSESKR